METFKTSLLSNKLEIPQEIFQSEEFNKYICDINADKKKSYSEIELKNLVYCLDYSYHYLGKALVPDNKFEALEEQVKKLYPDTILYSEKHMSQSILPCPMPSLTKIYNTDFDKIKNKISNFKNIVISSKLDGVSCLLVKNNKINLYTKGDGEKGRNISHILNYINLDTSKIPTKCILRGELIIKKESYHLFNTTRALRSQVIGLINRDFSKLSDEMIKLLKAVDLVFYHVIKPKNFTFFQQFEYLKQINLQTPLFKQESVEKITRKKIEDIYEKFLQDELYNIDGLVIAENDMIYDMRNIDSNYHNLLFAFKQNKHFAVTTITKIEWQTSKNCYLIPVLYCKPVSLLNSKITKCSGFNAKNIITRRLGIGAEVSITLAGNIIPSIDTVFVPSDDIKLPNNIRWEGNNIVSTIVDFSSISKVIEKYFSAFNIKGMSHKTIFNILVKLETENIMVSNIFDFFDGIKDWKIKFPTQTILGEKKDITLIDSLKKMSETPISIISILVATNFFYLISDVKMKTIFDDCPELYPFILDEDNSLDEDELENKLISIPSIGDKVAENTIKGINLFKENKTTFDKYFKITYESILQKRNNIPKIVFTEVKNVESYLEIYEGCFILALTLTKDINYLVTPNGDFRITSKYSKAEKYGIPIITLKEFKEMMCKKRIELAL